MALLGLSLFGLSSSRVFANGGDDVGRQARRRAWDYKDTPAEANMAAQYGSMEKSVRGYDTMVESKSEMKMKWRSTRLYILIDANNVWCVT